MSFSSSSSSSSASKRQKVVFPGAIVNSIVGEHIVANKCHLGDTIVVERKMGGIAPPSKPSGIFLSVWSESPGIRDMFLKTTKGGWPHITVVYTGKAKSLVELLPYGGNVLQELSGKNFILEKALVSTYVDKDGSTVYDVLLEFDDESTAAIKKVQTNLKKEWSLSEDVEKHSWHSTPHVTYQTNLPNRVVAEDLAEYLTEILQSAQFAVFVNGVFFS